MKKKTKISRLPIPRETVRHLSGQVLDLVQGGAFSKTSICCSGADPICNVTIINTGCLL